MLTELSDHPVDFLRFSPDAVLIVDGRHNIVSVNEPTYKLFGYTPDEFLDITISDLLPQGIAKQHQQLQDDYFDNPRIRGIGEKQDVIGVAKDGSIIDLDIKLVPYKISGDRYAMAVVRDVRKHVELRKEVQHKSLALSNLNEQLQTRNVQLLELNKIKNEFLGIAAHDLRGPVTSIMGNAEFLLDTVQGLDKSDETNALKDVLIASEHMLSVIDGFLDVSALESGQVSMHPVLCDLLSLLDRSINAISLQARDKGIGIYISTDSSIPALMLDEHRIKQVIDNYLSNAIKYSYKDSKVHITLSKSDSNVICAVADEGQGIEVQYIDELFQAFKQTSAVPTDGESSTGLGLYIVKSIIEKHGGNVWAESEPGRGSTFYFSLPLSLAL